MSPHPPRPTLFPYTTLFRSLAQPTDEPPIALFDESLENRVKAMTRIPKLLDRVNEDARSLLRARCEHIEENVCAIFGLLDRKSTRLNSSHVEISYAVFCLKK